MKKKFLFELWIATLVALLTVPFVYAFQRADYPGMATPLGFAIALVLLYVTIRTWEWTTTNYADRVFWIPMVCIGAFLIVLTAALGTFLPVDPELDYSIRSAVLLVTGLYGGIMTVVSTIWIANECS